MMSDDDVWLAYMKGTPVVKSDVVLGSLKDTLEARKADEEHERRLRLQANRPKALPRRPAVGPR